VAVAGNAQKAAIYTSADYGVNWVSNTVAATPWVSVASSADGTKLVAAGGGVYTNSGTTWTLAFSPGTIGNPQLPAAVASSADGAKLVLAANRFLGTSLIYTSANSGLSWLNVTSSPSSWTAVASSADGSHLVASCYNSTMGGSIYTSADGGALWVSNNAPSLSWNSLASSANGNTLLAAATPLLFTSANAGSSWTSVPNVPGPVSRVACSTNGSIWFAVSSLSGQIYSSPNAGATWVTNSSDLTNWSAIAVSADGTRGVAASGDGGIYVLQSAPAGFTLTLTLATNKVSILWPTNSEALGLGLEQSTNLAGTNWQTVTTTHTVTNANYQVTLPATNRQLFFRLASP
jgi:hypothetical protein